LEETPRFMSTDIPKALINIGLKNLKPNTIRGIRLVNLHLILIFAVSIAFPLTTKHNKSDSFPEFSRYYEADLLNGKEVV
jgi:hypothetical protein